MKRIILDDEGKFQLDVNDQLYTISLEEAMPGDVTRSGFQIKKEGKMGLDIQIRDKNIIGVF